jgi:hypothetical protein
MLLLVSSSTMRSTSAAVTEALTRWLHNKLLRLTLDGIYDEHPGLRPTPERVAPMARRVGITVPHEGDEVV